MPTALSTREVFLDTEVYAGEHFDMTSSKLSEVGRLASAGKIRILTTPITANESRKRIGKMVRSAVKLAKNKETWATLSILRQASTLDMTWMRKLEKDAVIQEITKKFDDFLSASKAIVCPLDSVSIEKLFSDYDAERPPFGADQKKDQFPDAAAMLCLAAWCKSNSKHAYVISADSDIKSVCAANPSFQYLSGLAEFLDLFNQHEQKLMRRVRMVLSRKMDKIEADVRERFEMSGFILTGEQGEVEHVEVEGIRLDKTYVISVHDDWAVVEAKGNVRFKADVIYDDFSTGYYDSEDGRYFGMDEIHKTVSASEDFTAEVEIEFDKKKPSASDVTVSVRFGDKFGNVEVEVRSPVPGH